MTRPDGSEAPPPFTSLLPRAWQGEAYRLLVPPVGELSGAELAAARALALLAGRYASEFLDGGADGANPHGIEPESPSAAYVRFVVAVLHDFGPASSGDLRRWKRRLDEGEPIDDPRVAAFRDGYRSGAAPGPTGRDRPGRPDRGLEGRRGRRSPGRPDPAASHVREA